MAKTEMKILALSFFAITLSLTIFTLVNGYGTIVGGRTPINDAKTNKGVQALGWFAVEEYNKGQQNNGEGTDELEFSQVVEAEKQIVSGIKYFLKIEAMENGEKKTFDTVILIKPWAPSQSKQLLSFSASTQ